MGPPPGAPPPTPWTRPLLKSGPPPDFAPKFFSVWARSWAAFHVSNDADFSPLHIQDDVKGSDEHLFGCGDEGSAEAFGSEAGGLGEGVWGEAFDHFAVGKGP